MQKTNKVVWFEIYVNEMDRAAKFYETVLDLKLESLPSPTGDDMEMRSFPGDMENYGCNGALVKMEGMKAGGSGNIIYFHSEDCTTEENKIETAGGKIISPKMQIGEHGFITLFNDTEGNQVGLHSMK